jgi:hypothetical protein
MTSEFIKERVERDVLAVTSIAAVKRSYEQFCMWNDRVVDSSRLFNQVMRQSGYQTAQRRVCGKNARCWLGVRLMGTHKRKKTVTHVSQAWKDATYQACYDLSREMAYWSVHDLHEKMRGSGYITEGMDALGGVFSRLKLDKIIKAARTESGEKRSKRCVIEAGHGHLTIIWQSLIFEDVPRASLDSIFDNE